MPRKIEAMIESGLALAQDVQDLVDQTNEPDETAGSSELLEEWDRAYTEGVAELELVTRILRDVAEGRGGHETVRKAAHAVLHQVPNSPPMDGDSYSVAG